MSGRIRAAMRRNLALKLISLGLAVLLYLLLRSTAPAPGERRVGRTIAPPTPAETSGR